MNEHYNPALLCPDCPAGSPADCLGDLLARRNGGLQTDDQAEGLLHMQRAMLVGLVASGYIHDLNNLLTMIIGGTALAADELPEGHPARETLDAVQQAGLSAGAVARRLMAFVRRRPVEPSAVALGRLAQDCLPLLSRLIGQHVVVASALGPELWTVRADPVQIEQVLLNLLINARDAMPWGGEVTIAGANVSAGAAEGVSPGEYVRLTVSDNGPGMSPETRERLFEPFFSGGSGGVGIGLSTCSWIVGQLGGTIHVDSAPGRGTTFAIYLPRAAA